MANYDSGRLSGVGSAAVMTGFLCWCMGLWSIFLLPFACAVVGSVALMFSTSSKW